MAVGLCALLPLLVKAYDIEALAGQLAPLWLPNVPPCSQPRRLGGLRHLSAWINFVIHKLVTHNSLTHNFLTHNSFTRHSFTHNSFTRSSLKLSILHHLLCLPCLFRIASTTFSDYWKKLTCEGIRSFNFDWWTLNYEAYDILWWISESWSSNLLDMRSLICDYPQWACFCSAFSCILLWVEVGQHKLHRQKLSTLIRESAQHQGLRALRILRITRMLKCLDAGKIRRNWGFCPENLLPFKQCDIYSSSKEV